MVETMLYEEVKRRDVAEKAERQRQQVAARKAAEEERQRQAAAAAAARAAAGGERVHSHAHTRAKTHLYKPP